MGLRLALPQRQMRLLSRAVKHIKRLALISIKSGSVAIRHTSQHEKVQ